MSDRSRINIVSSSVPEFSSKIVINDLSYYIQTEDAGHKLCKIISRIYHNGEVVFLKELDYSSIKDTADFAENLRSIMQNHHKDIIEEFLRKIQDKNKTRADYFQEMQNLLAKGKGKEAFELIQQAIESFPSDPFLLSYYGCLLALVKNRPKQGIKICIDSINKMHASLPFGSEFFNPVFYMNLGRCYLKDNNKPEAIRAFQEGLRSDPDNRELLRELKKLGIRKKPVFKFLKRSNPINKYIGLLLHKVKKQEE